MKKASRLAAVVVASVGVLTVGQTMASAATVTPQSTVHCGNTCYDKDPYTALTNAGSWTGVRCADTASAVGSSAHPKNSNGAVDSTLTLRQWYSTRCQTTWGVITTTQAIGRHYCQVFDNSIANGFLHNVEGFCGGVGSPGHTPMMDDYDPNGGAVTYAILYESVPADGCAGEPSANCYVAKTSDY